MTANDYGEVATVILVAAAEKWPAERHIQAALAPIANAFALARHPEVVVMRDQCSPGLHKFVDTVDGVLCEGCGASLADEKEQLKRDPFAFARLAGTPVRSLMPQDVKFLRKIGIGA